MVKNTTSTSNTPASNTEDNFQKVDLKRFLQISAWVIGFVYKLSPTHTVVFTVTQTILRLSDIANTIILAKLTDTLIKATQAQTVPYTDIYYILGLIFGVTVLTRILRLLERWAILQLRIVQRPVINRKFAEKISSLGIQTLEQPDVNNKIFRANSNLMNLQMYLEWALDLVSMTIKLVTLLGILLGFVPEYVLVIFVTMVPVFFFDKKFRVDIHKFFRINTENQRKAAASLNDLTGTKTLQEISLVQGYKFLDHKYWDFQKWYVATWLKINLKWSGLSNMSMTLSDLAILAAVLKVVTNALKQTISVGDALFQYRTLLQFQSNLRDVFGSVNDLMEQAIKMADVYDVFTMQPIFKDGAQGMKKLELGPDVVFDSISFKYPNAEQHVIENLNLKIGSGEKIAIVGANGAGKTTLIKLLCKFYQLTDGKILVNEQNITDLKTKDWHKNIGILFQDYNTYPQLTVKENILIGNSEEPVDEIAVRLAAEQADASEFINNFPRKYDQVLNEKYKGGIRPSTGQWQKLAIARFFYRNAPLVIFDEPTASIDAVSEYNIFNRIYEFFKNKTVIIISHRFSTVRNADRIIVLDKGKIIEQGSHEELMSLNGKYAEAFLLQAKGYAEKLY